MIPDQRKQVAAGSEKQADVWIVHVTMGDDFAHPEARCPAESVWTDEPAARREASARSRDPHVLAAAVSRMTLNVKGSRHRVALYCGGELQQLPHWTDDRNYVDG